MKDKHIKLFEKLSEDNQVALISAAVQLAGQHPRGATNLALETLLNLILEARGL